MTQTRQQLQFKVESLKSTIADQKRELQDLRSIETQADSKIKAMSKIHNDKIKSLLNSIQILKKEKASIEGLSKEHKRSKLIEQLNKEIMDQDIVIDVLRKMIYQDKGKEKARKMCDQLIVKALEKGPDRIRAVTREELRMEIQKLKLGTLSKLKVGEEENKEKSKNNGDESVISQVTEQSFVNQNQGVFKKLREIQTENQGLKLEISTKGKIIQKLKSEVKEKDRYKAEVELLTNQLEVSGRKVLTYQRMLRETKENMHAKISELYQRQLKVEQLQLNSLQHGEKLKHEHQSTNLLLQEMRQQKQQLMAQFQLLKKENQALMLDKMSMKKRQGQQKTKIQEIREINAQTKGELEIKLKLLTAQLDKLNAESERLKQIEINYFKQRAEWIEEKAKWIEEIQSRDTKKSQAELQQSTMQELHRLRKENSDLKEVLQSGTGGSDNKILLQRLENYRIRLQFYDSKGDKTKQKQLYDTLFQKYNNLLEQFQNFKKTGPSKYKRLNIVQITPNEEQKLHDFSSGISQLGLEEVGSQILDNYDSSYEYELRVDEMNKKKYKNVPKLTQQDKQLLKLINSDLWCFVTDDRVEAKIDEALSAISRQQQVEQAQLNERIKKLRNISSPQGKKFEIYESQLKELSDMNDDVSITSAMQREIDQYDSDVNIDIKKDVEGRPNINMRKLKNVSDSFSSDINVSSAKSGESSFVKKKKGQKATVIKLSKEPEPLVESSVSSEMNSSVSSVGVNESLLNEMNSDISVHYRAKKAKR